MPLANSPTPQSLATTTQATPAPSGPAAQLIVNPGENQEVNEASIVTLDGSASDFPPQAKVNWKLIFPKDPFVNVKLNNPNSIKATFEAPNVTRTTMLTFELKITDPSGKSASRALDVTVKDLNHEQRKSVTVSSASPFFPLAPPPSSTFTSGATLTPVPTSPPTTPVPTSPPTTPVPTSPPTTPVPTSPPTAPVPTSPPTTPVPTSPPTAPVPTSPPTAPASSGASTSPGTDKFGVRMLYPTIPAGEEWFMNMEDATNDPQFDPKDDVTKNPDGSWKMQSDQVRMNVFPSTGYDESSIATTNHGSLTSRGYMQGTNDWRDVEITGYVKVNEAEDDENFAWYARGGLHSDDDGCEGVAYKGDLYYNGGVQIAKEQFHVSYEYTEEQPVTGSMIGKWVGFKYVIYNVDQDGQIAVKSEIWVDESNNGEWVKAYEYIDSGGLGRDGSECEGSPDQIVSWGGPIATFRWDDAEDVDFKNLSVREITPVPGVATSTGGGVPATSTSTPTPQPTTPTPPVAPSIASISGDRKPSAASDELECIFCMGDLS